MEHNPRAAAIYCRISDDREGAGLGVARQQADCDALAHRLGWKVAATLTDNDLSAYSGKPRPEYRRLLDGLESRTYDAVLCWHPDRLHRSPRELEEFITVVEAAGAAVATVTAGALELSTPTGRMTARIVGAVARQESEHKSERIRSQRAQLAGEGEPHPGPRAFGYEEGNLTRREPEALLVAAAAAAVLTGDSIRAVADRWNHAGVTTARGNRWTVNAVRDVLTSPRSAGLRVHQGEVVRDGTWPELLDRATHERLVALAVQRRRGAGRPPTRLLSGVATCGRCGQSMRSTGGKGGTNTYACRKVPGNPLACGRLSVNADHADTEMRERAVAVLSGERLTRAVQARRGDADYAELAAELAADEAALVQLGRDQAARLIGRAEWLAMREVIVARMDDTRARLASSTARSALDGLPADDAGLRAWWEVATGEDRREVLTTLVERVEVTPSDPTRPRRFDPERLRVTWRA